MISLRRLIDSTDSAAVLIEDPPAARLADSGNQPETAGLLAAYRAALAAMGVSGQRAVPVLGDMISSALARVSEALTPSASSEAISESGRLVESELALWADSAEQHQKANDQAVKDLLTVVALAAESTGTRDEKFGREIAELSDRLRAVARLESLPVIRRSITENAGALTTCVTRMADEGRESIRKLTSEIAEYQARLQASERRALVDPLTGICNRRGFEQQLELQISSRQGFSLLLADLNDFKAANDRYGHLVGDEVLRQFAGELKSQFRAEDTVARWGGDEFAAIVVGPPQEGHSRADRIRHWALGDYKITTEGHTTIVKVEAAIGTVTWNGKESGQELFARVDKEMYRAKALATQTV